MDTVFCGINQRVIEVLVKFQLIYLSLFLKQQQLIEIIKLKVSLWLKWFFTLGFYPKILSVMQ